MNRLRGATLAVLIFATLFPSIAAFFYFILAQDSLARVIYSTSKAIQFTLPALWCFGFLRERFSAEKFSIKNSIAGLKTGLVFVSLIVASYFLVFARLDLLTGSGEAISEKLRIFGVHSTFSYVIMAAYISVLHSFLEEYYWRWFVYRKLREFASFPIAVLISSVGFTLHHIVVLCFYAPKQNSVLLVVLATLSVAIVGGVWAFQYERRRSLWAVWISHLLTDSALMFVGYQLIQWNRIGT